MNVRYTCRYTLWRSEGEREGGEGDDDPSTRAITSLP